MNCPGCDAELTVPEEGQEEQLHVCPECGGLTVEIADLKPLLLRHGLPGIESLGGRVLADGGTAVCRNCMIDMTAFEGGDRQEPEIYEVCEECGCVYIGEESLDPDVEPEKQVVAFFRRFAKGARKGP